MRVSVALAAQSGTCSGCDKTDIVMTFGIITDGHAGDADGLCALCLGGVLGGNGLSVDVPMSELAPGPAPRRKRLRKQKRRSQLQERELAEELGARTQPNSGAMSGAKGDVRKKGEFRLEAKYTQAASFSLVVDDLWKIASECSDGELPLFIIEYLTGTSNLSRFAVLNFEDFKELLNDAREHRRSKRAAGRSGQ
jgi:hypothetical protein